MNEQSATALVLASASPRRAALLSEAGYTFQTHVADIEEFRPGAFPAEALCCKNAERKARAVSLLYPAALVIGCDTIVCIDADVLGKPRDRAQAHGFLAQLQGRSHEVLSGVSLILAQEDYHYTFCESTQVTFRTLGDDDIDAYLDSITFIDKAGAYAIQDHGDMIVDFIKGSFTNVVGLPMERLQEALKSTGAPSTLRYAVTCGSAPRDSE